MKTTIQSVLRPLDRAFVAAAILLAGSAAFAQNLFVTDGNGILQITPNGSQATFVASGLSSAYALAFDGLGDLFEADTGTGNIYEFNPSGVRSTFASIPTEDWLAFNSTGDLFVAADNGNVYELTPSGSESTFASGLFAEPHGLAFNSSGDLFVAAFGSGDIYEFTPGEIESLFYTGLTAPSSLAFDNAGNLFVGTGAANGQIDEITPAGIESVFASGLDVPGQLAFNSAGDLFEADSGSGNIYEFTPGGVRSTFASGLSDPVGLAFAAPEPGEFGLIGLGVLLFGALRGRRQLTTKT